MDHDSEREFWDDVPTYSNKRVRVGSRSHVGAAPLRRRPSLRTLPGERNPLVLRIAVLVGVLLLLVPVILASRPNDGAEVLGSQGAGAMAVPNPAPEIRTMTVASTAPVLVADAPVTAAAPVVAPVAAPLATAAVAAVAVDAAPASKPGTGAPKAAATPAAAAPAAAVHPPTCAQTYTVLPGDYWIAIARRVSVKLKELLAANNATAATPLYPKRRICLPANAVVPVATPATTAVPAAAPTTTTKPTPAAPTTTTPAPTTTVPKPAPTTVPATTTTTTTLPARVYSRAEVEAIIREIWPDELEDEALRIATRESNLKPAVRNYCCFGLFQIYFTVHKNWLAGIGVTNGSHLFDPQVNAQAALTLYMRAGGWGPWQL